MLKVLYFSLLLLLGLSGSQVLPNIMGASYAMLGDIHIAEPGAVIGFAGRRVIEQTIREKLPEDFQTAEYLLEHGMVDMVVHRKELKETINRLVAILIHRKPEPILLSHDPSGSSGESSQPAVSIEEQASIPA